MNIFEKMIAAVSPERGLARARARHATALVERGYDAIKDGRRGSDIFRRKTSAASEVSAAANTLADVAQEACRNNPLAYRIKKQWAGNIVGSGIKADFVTTRDVKSKRDTKRHVKTLEKVGDQWDTWAESTNCDFDGVYDLYGLQWLWAAIVVETGGVIVRKHVEPMGASFEFSLQTIEQTYLDRTKDTQSVEGGVYIQDGIQFNASGRKEGYWIRSDKSGLNVRGEQTSVYLEDGVDAFHMFRKERGGQHLGVTWLAQSLAALDNYDVLVDAKVMQQQVASCLALVISEADENVDNGDKHERYDTLESGMVMYTKQGQEVNTVNPPSTNDSGLLEEVKTDAAAGSGLGYSHLTGDYSKFNFASGRMSKLDFYIELDFAQKLMFKPHLNTVYSWFSQTNSLVNRINMSKVRPVWTFPQRSAVNPTEELDIIVKKIRAGLMSPSQGAQAFGEKLADICEKWTQDREMWGDLVFDIDPSKFSNAGNQLDDNDAASSNNDKSDSKEKDKGKTDE